MKIATDVRRWLSSLFDSLCLPWLIQRSLVVGLRRAESQVLLLYCLKGDEQFTYVDGEVDSYEWRSLDNFKQITQDAERNNLVPPGRLYFETLIAALEYLASRS